MISFEGALRKVLDQIQDYGDERIPMAQALGRTLAEDLVADRDFPPFDRSERDGIAIQYGAQGPLAVAGTAQAGQPQLILESGTHCIEIMTGAMVPVNTDTVVMYEHLSRSAGGYKLEKPVQKGQHIHYRGSDHRAGEVLLPKGTRIDAAVVGLLASVGQAEVLVKTLPKIALVSTGNELVEVGEVPLPHQIRKSNTHTLRALLEGERIRAGMFHLQDDPQAIARALDQWMADYDVLLLSGGVSMGKFDFLPEAFGHLGVEKIFHKVAQRPGKPFWFGRHPGKECLIFSFPGNPVSTYVGHTLYFLPWLEGSMGRKTKYFDVILCAPYTNSTDLTHFMGARLTFESGQLRATMVASGGSGDLSTLAMIDGFVRIAPMTILDKGDLVPFAPTKNLSP